MSKSLVDDLVNVWRSHRLHLLLSRFDNLDDIHNVSPQSLILNLSLYGVFETYLLIDNLLLQIDVQELLVDLFFQLVFNLLFLEQGQSHLSFMPVIGKISLCIPELRLTSCEIFNDVHILFALKFFFDLLPSHFLVKVLASFIEIVPIFKSS